MEGSPGSHEPAFAGDAELDRFGDPTLCLAVMELLFSTPSWVHRRVEQLELITERHVFRRVSLDFTVPVHSPRLKWFAGDENFLIPVEVLEKGPLASFSIEDEWGAPVPVLTQRQNGRVAAVALRELAMSIVRESGEAWDAELEPLIVSTAQGPVESALRAMAELASLQSEAAKALHENVGFGAAANMLARNFLLLTPLPAVEGTRRILKWRYEDSLEQSSDKRTRWERFWEALALRTTTLEIPVPSFLDCESYHFEASAPDGIEFVDVVLGDEARVSEGVVDPRWTLGYRRLLEASPHRGHLSVSRTSTGQDVHDEFLDPRISLALRVERQGWLRGSAGAITLVAAFMWASLHWVEQWASEAAVAGPSGLERDPAGFTLAVIGVLTITIARSGQHAYTARAIRWLRRLILVGAAVPFGAAWLLVFPGPGCLATTAWLILSVLATIVAGVVGAAALKRGS